ncbi:MAG: PIN domain-containing protein [Candidatus Hodarchaeales archaeon]
MAIQRNYESEVAAAALDTGVIIEYLSLDMKNPADRKYAAFIEQTIIESARYEVLYISSLSITELLYVLCRNSNWEAAKKTTNELIANFIVLRSPVIEEIAAEIKCKCSISLADCYTLALGKILPIPVYFMKEDEFTPENQNIVKYEFSINLIMLDRNKQPK